MKKATVLLVTLLVVAGTLCVKAQTAETWSFTNLNQSIPDGNASGMHDVRTLSSAIASLASVRLRLRVAGEFNGDLYGYVRHIQGGTTNFCVLLNRPGRTAANPAGYADAGLNVVFDDAAVGEDIHVYQTVTNPPAGTPLTGAWQPDGRWVDPDVVLDTSPRTTTLSSFDSIQASGEWTLFLADLAAGGTNMLVSWELDFTGIATPTVTWPTPADIVYGTALSSALLNASSLVPGTFAYNPAAGTFLSAGSNQTLSVTFTPTDTNSYVSVTTNVSVNVLKKPLGITANNTNKVYGQTVSFAGTEFSSSGLVNSDTVTGVTLTSAGAVATATVAGSPYSIVPSAATGTGLPNYTIGYTNGTLTVSARPLGITANNTNKVYGQTVRFAGTEFSSSGLVNSDTVTGVTLTSAGTVATATVAGSPYSIVPSAATGTGLANYTIGYTNGTLTVSAKPLGITANNTNKVYGQTVSFAGTEFSGSGLVNSDTVTGVTLTSAGALATATVAGSPYSIVPSAATGTGLANYTIGYTNGTLTVSAKPLGITANNTNKVYGQTVTFAGTEFSSSGLVNSDTVTGVTLTSAGTAAAATVAGSPYSIVPSAATGTGLANYTIGYTNGTLTVSAKALGITANNTNKVYGQTVTFAGTEFTTSGLVNSDTVTGVTLTSAGTAATATVAGSPYSIVPSAATGTGLANYTIGYTNGILTITKASTSGILGSSSNPSPPNQPIVFTVALSAVAPGAGTPTGTVQFRMDSTNVVGPVSLSGGTASCTTSNLAHGTHTVAAEYAGDGNFTGTTNLLSPAQLINTPPVAGPVTLQRDPTNGVKVSVAALLTNCSDADGDPITFVGVSATSANGGTIVSNAGWVFYTPAPGFTNTDTFTYTVSDSFGALATGTVTVNIRTDNGPSPNLTITDLRNGTNAILGDGIPNRTYRIQFSETLPTTNWQTLGTATSDPYGIFQFLDTNASAQRFYRSVYP